MVRYFADIIVPGTNVLSTATSRIPAGESVLVIKTPNGVYLRSEEGKIFAMRPNDADRRDKKTRAGTLPNDTVLGTANATSTATTTKPQSSQSTPAISLAERSAGKYM